MACAAALLLTRAGISMGGDFVMHQIIGNPQRRVFLLSAAVLLLSGCKPGEATGASPSALQPRLSLIHI